MTVPYSLVRPAMRSNHPSSEWSGRGDLNPRPPAPKAGALPLRHFPVRRIRGAGPGYRGGSVGDAAVRLAVAAEGTLPHPLVMMAPW